MKRRQSPQPDPNFAIGMEAFCDAITTIRCLATGDAKTLTTVFANNPHHDRIALALGAFALTIGDHNGMSPAAVDAYLRAMCDQADDYLAGARTPQAETAEPADPLEWDPRAGEGLTPELGIDVFRDAGAVIRAVVHGDSQGSHAVLTGTDAPRHLASALATMLVTICRRGGLDDTQIDTLATESASEFCDAVLDTHTPTTKGVHGA